MTNLKVKKPMGWKTKINWFSALKNLKALSWSELTDLNMIGHSIYLVYPNPNKDGDLVTEEILKIAGADNVGGEQAVVVKNWSDEDFLILEEGKGTLWEAYEIKTI